MKLPAQLEELIDYVKNDSSLLKNVACVMWYGSSQKKRYIHTKSDIDIEIYLKTPEPETLLSLTEILPKHNIFDVSIIYLSDLYSKDSSPDYQHKTKGIFFAFVVNSGVCVYGKPVLEQMVKNITDEQINESLLFSMREVLGRLRTMLTIEPQDDIQFKKYYIRVLKKLIILKGVVSFSRYDMISNHEIVEFSEDIFKSTKAITLINQIVDYDTAMDLKDRCEALVLLENIVNEFRNDRN